MRLDLMLCQGLSSLGLHIQDQYSGSIFRVRIGLELELGSEMKIWLG